MQLRLNRLRLATRHPFTIARGTTTVQETLIVELEQNGVCGYGEAAHVPYYAATIDATAAAIEQVRPAIEMFDFSEPTPFWAAMTTWGIPSTAARCALDCAAHDLWGKLAGKPVHRLWGLDPGEACLTDYTIGIDTIEVMVRKLQEFAGWPIYKIKLGTEHDLEIVQALREHTDAVFRIDANCAWTVEQTLAIAPELKRLGVELVEQPLPPDDWQGMELLHGRCPLPILADESCRLEADVERCAAVFQGINIKLIKCGGLSPARRMIRQARDLGMKVMAGCFTESSVCISAAAQLLPLLDYADLDGALLLAEDAASGVCFHHGRAIYPETPGCGIAPRGQQEG